MLSATVTWKVGSVYEGVSGSGFEVVTASKPDTGEPQRGPLPMELVLIALGSCTAMDVTGILRKMRAPFTGLTVTVRGERVDEHPRVFSAIELEYAVRGAGLDPAMVERAIRLSQERYCSVSAMLRPAVRLMYTWRVEQIEPEQRRLTA
jgi:putative redox protein